MNRFTWLLYVALVLLLVVSPSLAKHNKDSESTTTAIKHNEDHESTKTTSKRNNKPTSSSSDDDNVPTDTDLPTDPVGNGSTMQSIVSNVEARYDGVLIVNSEQTSCEVAVANELYGFVAANCLTVNGKMPSYLVTDQDEETACSLGSPVFSANRNNFICSNSTTMASVSKSCSLPYGLVYGVVKSNSVAPAAIYSHTVVFGSGLCSNFKKLNYYIQLGSYLTWGAKVAGYTPKIDGSTNSNGSKSVLGDITFSMKDGGSSVPGVAVYGGNLYSLIPSPTTTKPTTKPTGTKATSRHSPTPSRTVTVSVTRTVYVTRHKSSAGATNPAGVITKTVTVDVTRVVTRTKSPKSSKTGAPAISNISEVTNLPIPTNLPAATDANTATGTNSTATNSTDTNSTATSSTTPTTSEELTSTEGMSSKTKILIGVFVGIAVLGIGAFCLYYFYYRRR
ncbi:hypothetical protein H4R26_002537 [Coemansia thaxteri]|uniref:Uncharacterized protein n=1 Tax=Coemansia thaxteri TaxID=2663907 RepID=A0A9W8EFJ0_9FUNG|nr:hypothetical protein H4R26_002537 [Coemansia thaxteri]KAJ2482315.1 hypothetical protein EV174_003236 [Coemansia sp. RSA 2320]